MHHRFLPNGKNTARPWLEKDRNAVVVGENIGLKILPIATETNIGANVSDTLMSQKLFILKGNNETELNQQLAALAIAIDTKNTLAELAQQFYTKANTKTASYSLILIAKNKKALTTEIKFFQKTLVNAFNNGKAIKTPKGSYFTPKPLGKKGKVAFVYPGSATAYEGLGRELFQLFPQLYTCLLYTSDAADE